MIRILRSVVRWGIVAGAMLGAAEPASAQSGAFISLHHVKLTQGNHVELSLTTNIDDCFLLLDEDNQVLNPFVICNEGVEDFVLEEDRDEFFPELDIDDLLNLRAVAAGVSSNMVPITGDLILHSVTIIGDEIEIVYTKSFSECVDLQDDTGSNVGFFASVLCDPGENVSAVFDREQFYPDVETGDVVQLGLLIAPHLDSATVTVQEDDNAVFSCVLSEEPLRLLDRAAVTATNIHSNQDIFAGAQALFDGTLTGQDDAFLHPTARVTQDVRLIDDFFGNVNNVGGTVFEGVPVPNEMLTTSPVLSGGQDFLLGHDTQLTLPPGAYGRVELLDRSNLRLVDGGDYIFRELRMGNDSRLRVNTATSANVNIQVRDSLTLGDRFRVTELNGSAPNPFKITWYTNASTVNVRYDSRFAGSLTAPNAFVQLLDRAEARGCVRARRVQLGYDAKILGN